MNDFKMTDSSSAASGLLRQSIVHINTDADLKDVCGTWLSAGLLAVDTEFMRVDTYYPIAALIQVNDGQANYLIDPLTITDWQPLAEVMASKDVVKVFHACGEDLDVFNHLLGALPQRLLDTQVAASLLGYGASVGYGNLVNECLQVDLPKGETRSNWLARPLSEGQVMYAALDVDYLYGLAKLLIQQLHEKTRLVWACEDSEALKDNFLNNQDPASGFYKSKNTWRLKSAQLAPCKALFEWRENTARAKNIPRNRILKDNFIFDVVVRNATEAPQLKSLGLHDGTVRRYGEEIVAVNLVDYSEQALIAAEKPLTKPQREQIKGAREVVTTLAEKHGIAPEVLVRKAHYQEWVRLPAADNILAALATVTTGWRSEFLAKNAAEQ